MRSVLLSMLGICCWAPLAAAQTEPWANKLFPTVTHNFGVVPLGTQLKHSLPMTNVWKVPIEIQEIRVSCGCVKATASKNRLQPGEAGVLDINMDGTKFNGSKSVNIYVQIGPQYKSTAVLTIAANTTQAVGIAFNPPNGIDFGGVTKGAPVVQAIEVRNRDNPAWQVIEIVKTQSAPFDLEVENVPGQGRGYKIQAKLKADAPKGAFQELVTLKTNDPTNPLLKFTVSGNVQSTLRFTSPVAVNNLRVGAEASTTIVLSAARPFRLTGLNGLGEDVNVDMPIDSKQVHVLSVKIKPNSAGEYRRTLVIQTDLNNESAVINLEGVAQ